MTNEKHFNLCKYCGRKIKDMRRKYCDSECNAKYMLEGPAKERYKYELIAAPVLAELEEMTAKGTWLLFPASFEDEQCIGDFIRAFKRPPDHVIWMPSTPIWKYTGPVWDKEQNARRWQGVE
jgi:hypothetical protein